LKTKAQEVTLTPAIENGGELKKSVQENLEERKISVKKESRTQERDKSDVIEKKE